MAWIRQYSDVVDSQLSFLEVVANYDLWIYHAHFGLLGSNNEIMCCRHPPISKPFPSEDAFGYKV